MSDSAYIYLEDGTVLSGKRFGHRAVKSGELVFTTSMNGYPESLTDPSYAGQILIMTHPLVGNYGVPKKKTLDRILANFESERIHVEGLVVSELTSSDKWSSEKNLDDWMKECGIPGISGIDTRMLTKTVRDKGAMMCAVSTRGKLRDPEGELGKRYTRINFLDRVSPKSPIVHGHGRKSIVVVDCGVKHGILENLSRLGYSIVRVPYNYTASQIMSYRPVGVVYSNGPGNPNMMNATVDSMKSILEYGLPVFGICLGHQIATIALGGKVRKMKFGHRAVNKAVIDVTTGKAYITTHNHGYAVLRRDMPKGAKMWFLSPDDGIVEGMKFGRRNMITTQFHPEARPGTNDAGFIFKAFDKMIKDAKN
ncbi:MAG: glutamine-hydrolyzing carbamoyl-phosphate synthase small subunit [Candidatus Micrarchaeota archaeon]|nr:glutamine-hydrolyzing carbamoyl-phosphate synthase small subunit [Candidatus Micrarchaeota archaeon]